MLERLDFWLAIFTLGALAYFELRLGRFIGPIVRGVVSIATPAAKEVKRRAMRQLPTTVRLKPRPIRDDRGRFDGSLPAEKNVTTRGNELQLPLHDVAALGRGVASGNVVAEVTVSPDEMMLISLRLGRGMSPSAVIKSMPGYSPRKNYDLYKAKVDQVQAALAEIEPAEDLQAEDVRA